MKRITFQPSSFRDLKRKNALRLSGGDVSHPQFRGLKVLLASHVLADDLYASRP